MANRVTLTREDPSPESIHHLKSTWTSYLFTEAYTPITVPSRKPRPEASTTESLLAKTLNTSSTIIAWQNFTYTPDAASSTSQSNPQFQVLAAVKLGSGLNGHTDIAHGGFVAVLLDEIIGNACECTNEKRVFTMTAYLNVSYKRPIPTPAVVLLRGWVEKREGRKIWGKGTVEDEQGNVLSSGDALFVEVSQKL